MALTSMKVFALLLGFCFLCVCIAQDAPTTIKENIRNNDIEEVPPTNIEHILMDLKPTEDLLQAASIAGQDVGDSKPLAAEKEVDTNTAKGPESASVEQEDLSKLPRDDHPVASHGTSQDESTSPVIHDKPNDAHPSPPISIHSADGTELDEIDDLVMADESHSNQDALRAHHAATDNQPAEQDSGAVPETRREEAERTESATNISPARTERSEANVATPVSHNHNENDNHDVQHNASHDAQHKANHDVKHDGHHNDDHIDSRNHKHEENHNTKGVTPASTTAPEAAPEVSREKHQDSHTNNAQREPQQEAYILSREHEHEDKHAHGHEVNHQHQQDHAAIPAHTHTHDHTHDHDHHHDEAAAHRDDQKMENAHSATDNRHFDVSAAAASGQSHAEYNNRASAAKPVQRPIESVPVSAQPVPLSVSSSDSSSPSSSVSASTPASLELPSWVKPYVHWLWDITQQIIAFLEHAFAHTAKMWFNFVKDTPPFGIISTLFGSYLAIIVCSRLFGSSIRPRPKLATNVIATASTPQSNEQVESLVKGQSRLVESIAVITQELQNMQAQMKQIYEGNSALYYELQSIKENGSQLQANQAQLSERVGGLKTKVDNLRHQKAEFEAEVIKSHSDLWVEMQKLVAFIQRTGGGAAGSSNPMPADFDNMNVTMPHEQPQLQHYHQQQQQQHEMSYHQPQQQNDVGYHPQQHNDFSQHDHQQQHHVVNDFNHFASSSAANNASVVDDFGLTSSPAPSSSGVSNMSASHSTNIPTYTPSPPAAAPPTTISSVSTPTPAPPLSAPPTGPSSMASGFMPTPPASSPPVSTSFSAASPPPPPPTTSFTSAPSDTVSAMSAMSMAPPPTSQRAFDFGAQHIGPPPTTADPFAPPMGTGNGVPSSTPSTPGSYGVYSAHVSKASTPSNAAAPITNPFGYAQRAYPQATNGWSGSDSHI